MRLRIKELREQKGWTQTELGERAGYNQSKIVRLEQGKGIRLQVLVDVAQALGVPQVRLFEFSDADELSRAIELFAQMDRPMRRALVNMAEETVAATKPAA